MTKSVLKILAPVKTYKNNQLFNSVLNFFLLYNNYHYFLSKPYKVDIETKQENTLMVNT